CNKKPGNIPWIPDHREIHNVSHPFSDFPIRTGKYEAVISEGSVSEGRSHDVWIDLVTAGFPFYCFVPGNKIRGAGRFWYLVSFLNLSHQVSCPQSFPSPPCAVSDCPQMIPGAVHPPAVFQIYPEYGTFSLRKDTGNADRFSVRSIHEIARFELSVLNITVFN